LGDREEKEEMRDGSEEGMRKDRGTRKRGRDEEGTRRMIDTRNK
jgi:hypothetical protein